MGSNPTSTAPAARQEPFECTPATVSDFGVVVGPAPLDAAERVQRGETFQDFQLVVAQCPAIPVQERLPQVGPPIPRPVLQPNQITDGERADSARSKSIRASWLAAESKIQFLGCASPCAGTAGRPQAARWEPIRQLADQLDLRRGPAAAAGRRGRAPGQDRRADNRDRPGARPGVRRRAAVRSRRRRLGAHPRRTTSINGVINQSAEEHVFLAAVVDDRCHAGGGGGVSGHIGHCPGIPGPRHVGLGWPLTD